MKLIVHSPKSKELKDELSKKISEVYSLAVKFNTENLKCSKNQKLKLLDDIIKSKENY